MTQMMAQIRDSQKKVNSLSDAREFYDPETASSSGATHVPSQPSTTPSPRTVPCRDSGLPHDTRNIIGTSGNVFERLPARERPPSTIFHNSKNLASSSQELRHDISETAKRERERKRESLNAPIQSPHFHSRSGMLNHTGGTCSHCVLLWITREFLSRDESWEIS